MFFRFSASIAVTCLALLTFQIDAQAQRGARPTQSEVRAVIAKVQRRLNAMGYNAGRADGRLGRKTIGAIRRFQQDNGFSPTGRLTREQARMLATWRAPNRSRAGGVYVDNRSRSNGARLQTGAPPARFLKNDKALLEVLNLATKGRSHDVLAIPYYLVAKLDTDRRACEQAKVNLRDEFGAPEYIANARRIGRATLQATAKHTPTRYTLRTSATLANYSDQRGGFEIIPSTPYSGRSTRLPGNKVFHIQTKRALYNARGKSSLCLLGYWRAASSAKQMQWLPKGKVVVTASVGPDFLSIKSRSAAADFIDQYVRLYQRDRLAAQVARGRLPVAVEYTVEIIGVEQHNSGHWTIRTRPVHARLSNPKTRQLIHEFGKCAFEGDGTCKNQFGTSDSSVGPAPRTSGIVVSGNRRSERPAPPINANSPRMAQQTPSHRRNGQARAFRTARYMTHAERDRVLLAALSRSAFTDDRRTFEYAAYFAPISSPQTCQQIRFLYANELRRMDVAPKIQRQLLSLGGQSREMMQGRTFLFRNRTRLTRYDLEKKGFPLARKVLKKTSAGYTLTFRRAGSGSRDRQPEFARCELPSKRAKALGSKVRFDLDFEFKTSLDLDIVPVEREQAIRLIDRAAIANDYAPQYRHLYKGRYSTSRAPFKRHKAGTKDGYRPVMEEMLYRIDKIEHGDENFKAALKGSIVGYRVVDAISGRILFDAANAGRRDETAKVPSEQKPRPDNATDIPRNQPSRTMQEASFSEGPDVTRSRVQPAPATPSLDGLKFSQFRFMTDADELALTLADTHPQEWKSEVALLRYFTRLPSASDPNRCQALSQEAANSIRRAELADRARAELARAHRSISVGPSPNRLFRAFGTAHLGEYDFERAAFPINSAVGLPLKRFFRNSGQPYCQLKTGRIGTDLGYKWGFVSKRIRRKAAFLPITPHRKYGGHYRGHIPVPKATAKTFVRSIATKPYQGHFGKILSASGRPPTPIRSGAYSRMVIVDYIYRVSSSKNGNEAYAGRNSNVLIIEILKMRFVDPFNNIVLNEKSKKGWLYK